MSIHFWKGTEGKSLNNPEVLCLNLLSCYTEEPEQAHVRSQFGVYNVEIKKWEMCHISRVVLHLQNTNKLLLLGYRDLSILDRHMQSHGGDVCVFVKIQLVPTEAERHSLSQDLARMLSNNTRPGENTGKY
jgi:speckle-type POZ protein